MKQERPLLSISLLASNCEEEIRRCLDSLKPIMEQLPCELILVDTSKDAKIGQLLREYTDCVIPFSWCNDFAKARNVGLKAAKGEWFLYLDDDEWFTESKELIDFFLSGEYRQYGYANYIQRNFFDPGYENFTDSWVSRMICLLPDTTFRSRIHEYLFPAYGACKNIHAIVNHSGYIYTTKEERWRKFKRNEPLLLAMIEEEPTNLRWRVQLAQEYYAVEEWEVLADFCKESLEYLQVDKVDSKCNENCNVTAANSIPTFYAGLAEGLICQGQNIEAVKQIEKAKSDACLTPLGHAYLCLAESCAHLALRNWKEAEANLTTYFSMQAQVVEDEDQYVKWQEALIADSVYDTVSIKKAYSILLCCRLMLGETDNLQSLFDKLEWDKNAVYIYPPTLSVLFEGMLLHEDTGINTVFWKNIWKNEKLYAEAVTEVKKNWDSFSSNKKEEYKETYDRIQNDFLKKYYRKEIIADYPELLSGMAQNAKRMIEKIEESIS